MKIAIATDNGMVAAHFGRCPEYTIVDIEGKKIIKSEVIPNPGHEPGFLPRYLAEREVDCIIAGGMGPRAQGLFAQNNIETIIGVTGKVDNVVSDFINGRLQKGESSCNHGIEGHRSCDH